MTRSQPSLELLSKLGQEILPVNWMFLKYKNALLIQLRDWAKKHCKLLHFLLRIGFTCITNHSWLNTAQYVGGKFYGHDWQCKCQIKKSGYILHRKEYNIHRNYMATTELNGSGEKAAQEKAKGPQRAEHNAVSCFACGRVGCLRVLFCFVFTCVLVPLITYRR